MASETAKLVAQDVIAAKKKGGKIVLGEIVEKRGYAESTIRHPKRVTETQSFKKEIAPFVKRLTALRDKILTEMESKDISQEKFTELGKTLQGITHDIQLISGGETERVAVIPILANVSSNDGNEEDNGSEQKNQGDSGGDISE